MSSRALVLAVGVLLWCSALALTPSELEAAKKRERIGARTAVTMVVYLAAAVTVLAGLAPKRAPRS